MTSLLKKQNKKVKKMTYFNPNNDSDNLDEMLIADPIIAQIKKAKQNRKDFIPGYDGLQILREMIPAEQAIKEGKTSRTYKVINEAFKLVQIYINFLENKQTENERAGNVGVANIKPNIDFYDNRRDRFKNEQLAPYKGTFGWYDQK